MKAYGRRMLIMGTLIFSGSLHAGNLGVVSINPKLGIDHFDNRKFQIFGNEVVADSTGTIIGVTALYKFNFGVAVGGEFTYTYYEVDTDEQGDPGHISIYQPMAIAQYHMLRDSHIQPFVGLGYGKRWFGLHSGSDVNLRGDAWQYGAGVSIFFGREKRRSGAMTIELRHTEFDVDDVNGARVDTASDSLLIGGSINF